MTKITVFRVQFQSRLFIFCCYAKVEDNVAWPVLVIDINKENSPRWKFWKKMISDNHHLLYRSTNFRISRLFQGFKIPYLQILQNKIFKRVNFKSILTKWPLDGICFMNKVISCGIKASEKWRIATSDFYQRK